MCLTRSVTTWMICETAPPDPKQTFAHSHPLEVFNSGNYPYCEAEWHSPVEHLKPKATMLFTQEFSIWSDPAVGRPWALFGLGGLGKVGGVNVSPELLGFAEADCLPKDKRAIATAGEHVSSLLVGREGHCGDIVGMAS